MYLQNNTNFNFNFEGHDKIRFTPFQDDIFSGKNPLSLFTFPSKKAWMHYTYQYMGIYTGSYRFFKVILPSRNTFIL